MCNVMVSLGPLLCITPQVFYRRSPLAATNIVPSLNSEYQAFLWGERGKREAKRGENKGREMPDKHAQWTRVATASAIFINLRWCCHTGHVMMTKVCKHLNAIQNQEVTQHETHVVASFL